MQSGASKFCFPVNESEFSSNGAEEKSRDLEAAIRKSDSDVPSGPGVNGVAIGSITGFAGERPIVRFVLTGEAIQMKAIAVACELDPKSDCGAMVCISFQDCNPFRPIVIGRIVGGLPGVESESKTRTGLRLNSENEIVLRCGQASIQLKADGTVAIRGKNVATRATHTNRIRGGNVQIN